MLTGELRSLEHTKESVGIRLAWSPDPLLFSGEYFNLNLTSFFNYEMYATRYPQHSIRPIYNNPYQINKSCPNL
jgi:hypothetical protein